MRNKFQFAAAFLLLLSASALCISLLRPRPLKPTDVARQNLARFARHIERLAEQRGLEDRTELRALLATEVQHSHGLVIGAALRDQPVNAVALRQVRTRSGTALVASFPIHFSGQVITLRLATLVHSTQQRSSPRSLAA